MTDTFSHVSRPAGKRKDRIAAYTLWFMVGPLGAHRFYVDRPWTGILMAAFTMLSIPAALLVSIAATQWVFVAVTLWWAVDGLLILKWIPRATADDAAGEFGQRDRPVR